MNALRGKLPLGAVALLLVLVLAVIGLVYGNWSQKLTITGTVGTGSVSANWNAPIGKICLDNEDNANKNVGEMTLNVTGEKTLAVTLTNVYPNFIGDCEPEIHYTGNIPGVVESITLTGKGIDCDVAQAANTGTFEATCFDSTTGLPAIQVNWNNGLCTQLAGHSSGPHLTDKTGSSMLVKVLKTAEQKATYGFNIEIQIVQFDKSACP